MQHTGNTVLITGGGSGIGRALAEKSHQAGSQVIIAGRRRELLEEVTAANPGMKSVVLDLSSAEHIRQTAQTLVRDYPALNVVINNAGTMQVEKLQDLAGNVDAAEAMITTNLLGPIRLTAALLPHLLQQPGGAIMMVSSGLAMVPLALTPTYSATKAAIHSYTQSLRYQLAGTKVNVVELIPPYVQTELGGDHQKTDPRAMPLDEFITEVWTLMNADPMPEEINVEKVKPLRFAAESGQYAGVFKGLNDAMTAPALGR